jgi:hypothetical protein
LAVATGATTPVPSGGAGSLIWSTTASTPLVWDGTHWVRCYSGGGSGDVVGPSSATDKALARFSGTTGKLVQNSGATLSDLNQMKLPIASPSGTSAAFEIATGFAFPGDINQAILLSGFNQDNQFNAICSGNNAVSDINGAIAFHNVSGWRQDIDFYVNQTGGPQSLATVMSAAPVLRIENTGKVLVGTTTADSSMFKVAGEGQVQRLLLPAQGSDPAAPSSGQGLVYTKALAGRNVPRFRAPSGISYALSPHLGGNNMRAWRGGASTTATTFAAVIGAMPYTGASPTAPTIPALASTNLLTQTYRSTISTGASAGGLAYIRGNGLNIWRGNAAGLGGFLVIHRFALSGTLQAGLRAFAGIVDVAANPTNIDPTGSTTPGGVGIAVNANSGNWKLVNNITGTARTATDLGANFPVNNTDLLEIALWCAPNDSGIGYQVTNLSTSNTATGTLTTNIPAAAAFLAPAVWVTNNATAAAQTLDFVSTYVETDY